MFYKRILSSIVSTGRVSAWNTTPVLSSASLAPKQQNAPPLNFSDLTVSNVSEIVNHLNSVTAAANSVVRQITRDQSCIEITWLNGTRSKFDNMWLRDNCRCAECFHAGAHERIVDLKKVCDDNTVASCAVQGDDLHVEWSCSNHASRYSLKWLHEYSGVQRDSEVRLWGSEKRMDMPEIEFEAVMKDDDGVRDWLNLFHRDGFTLIRNVPLDLDQCRTVAERIGFLRKTFWGETWDVQTEPNPQNLSLTGAELGCHTDFSWAKNPPGLQFLHCMKFQVADGQTCEEAGTSVLVDGFLVAQLLRERNPAAYKLLCTQPVPFCFRGNVRGHCHQYLHRAPVFELDTTGQVVKSVRYNQANRAPLDVDSGCSAELFEALGSFWDVVTSPSVRLCFRLQEGDLLVFNNHRLMHGRTSYNPAVVTRHLRGCYMDIEEYDSRRAQLNSQLFPTESGFPCPF